MYQKFLSILLKHTDKVFHFTAGMIICLIASIFLQLWGAALIVFLFGLGKEIRDWVSYGLFDWKDFAATILGGGFVLICLYLG